MSKQLLTSQKNEVLAVIRQMGLDPLNFKWTERRRRYLGYSTGSYDVPVLEYKGTEFYFLFDQGDEGHEASFSPGHQTLVQHDVSGSWESHILLVRIWLEYLKRELDAPDMWEGLSKYSLPRDSHSNSQANNELFSRKEVAQLAEGLKKLRKYVEAEFDVNEQQLTELDHKLDNLLTATTHIGKKDWLLLAIGTIFTYALSVALPPDQATRLWLSFKASLGGLIHLLQ